MLFDLILLVLTFVGVYFFRFGYVSEQILTFPAFWFIVLFILCSFYVFGTYELDSGESPVQIIIKTGLAILVGLLVIVLLNYLFANVREGLFGRGVLLGSFIVYGGMAILYRIPFVHFFNSFRSELNWLVIIDREDLLYLKGDLAKRGLSGHIVFLTQDGVGGHGTWERLDIFLNKRWSGVISAIQGRHLSGELGQILMKAKLAGHNVIALSKFSEQHLGAVLVRFLNPEWFIAADSFHLVHNPMGLRVKRLADISLSSLLLFVSWPLMLICAVAIRLDSQGIIIYQQVRTGKDGRLFTIYKFRSMIHNAEENGVQWAQQNDNRITRVGRVMRATRLDELPQLFNVFRGDMSFVGPRPERPEFNEELNQKIPYYSLRHMVRPGITGWAQVSYPYGASIEDSFEKLQYDLFYIKNFSFLLDFIIILRTIRVILFSRGR